MRRVCTGADPNLLAADGESPCACGRAFDDAERFVVWPHELIGGGPDATVPAVTLDQEDDGRWIAEAKHRDTVACAYGATPHEARANALRALGEALADLRDPPI